MWKQILIASALTAGCVPAGPPPQYYGPPPQYAQPQPQPQPQPDPYVQPVPTPAPDPQPYPQPPPPPAPDPWRFDARGWTLLGTHTVDGRADRDAINVGRYRGRFDQLTLVVYDADLRLDDLQVVFGDGSRWSPRLRHVFRQNARSRAIDLPGDNRVIARVDLRYSNLAGAGAARIEVYGRDLGTPPPPPPPPAPEPWRFDSVGWTLLGSQTVGSRPSRAGIRVGRYQGRFDQVTIVVYDADVRLDNVTITFGDRTRFADSPRHVFRDGHRSRIIDLPGDDRVIRTVDLGFSQLQKTDARVEIYGRDTGKPRPQPTTTPPPAPDPWKFDARGWTLLGSESVDGRRDRDTIRVTRYQGRFDQLTLVVYDSDLELHDFVVTFGDRTQFSPKLKHVFQQNQRSRVIELPGDDRVINTIDLAYANLPGGGKARVEIYGRDTGKPRPPQPDPWKFDARGWTLLGAESVDGRRDRDTIRVTRYQGRFDQLTLVVYDSDLELHDFVVTFGNKSQFSPKLKHVFKQNQRSRVIDLPGDDRVIDAIDLAYANLPGGGKARVEVYGRDTGKPRPPQPDPTPPPPPADPDPFDPTGWTVLGRTVVDGAHDRDVVAVNDGAAYKELLLRVVDSDLELDDVTITFGNNEVYSPGTKILFRQGARTRAIDLPGNARRIKSIALSYGNRPGGGKAAVEIYGKLKAKPGRGAKGRP